MEEKHFLMEVYFFLSKSGKISEEIHQYLIHNIEYVDITAVETGFTRASI
jgi:hypothetical protein